MKSSSAIFSEKPCWHLHSNNLSVFVRWTRWSFLKKVFECGWSLIFMLYRRFKLVSFIYVDKQDPTRMQQRSNSPQKTEKVPTLFSVKGPIIPISLTSPFDSEFFSCKASLNKKKGMWYPVISPKPIQMFEINRFSSPLKHPPKKKRLFLWDSRFVRFTPQPRRLGIFPTHP